MTGLADSYKVEIEFPSSALLGNAFTLDDGVIATTRTNLVTNPNFEVNTTGWTAYNSTGTRDTTQFYVGTASYKLVGDGSQPYCSAAIRSQISPSTQYTFSYYAKATVGTPNARATLNWYTAGGAYISQSVGTSTALSTSWGRRTVTATAPATATQVDLIIECNSGVSLGTTVFADAILIEAASSALPYFDGTYVEVYTGYSLYSKNWNGTADNSTSTASWVLSGTSLGELDGFGRLGGRAFYDVTSLVQEITINRGRSRQLDSFNAGQATVVFNNNLRTFDPTNTSGIYYGGIAPRQPIRISANSTYIFYGWIDDWNIEYGVPTSSKASVYCADAFSILSTIFIEEFATTNGQRSDQRIQTIFALPEVSGLSLSSSLETGIATLGDDLIPDQTVLLDYLQQINQSEFGYLYIDGSGVLQFIARGADSSFASATSATLPIFTDQTPAPTLEFKYSAVGVQFGTELLYNRVNAQNVDGGILQVADDVASQSEYQIRTFGLTNLILETDADALELANYILAAYARPVFRYDSATVSIQGLNTTNQNTLLGIELASLVKIVKNFSTGTPTSVEKYALVEGIEHTITLTEHTVKYNLSNVNTDALRLDSALFGILDSSELGS